MRDIDTALLRTFITLAETRSFTRTAERIHRSQSAASMQIAKLEELLECRLFERTRRSVVLTPDGEKLMAHARQMVSMADELLDRFREPDMEGEVTLGAPEDFATTYLPAVLGDFSRAHPRVVLNFNCDLTLDLIRDFEGGRYDLVVIKQNPRRLHEGARPLWRERLVWVGPASLGTDETFRQSVRRLCGRRGPLPLVLSPAPCVYRERATEALDRAGVPWKVVYTSTSFAGASAAVRSGIGMTVFPRNLVPEGLLALEHERGWPSLKDVEMCLLARQVLSRPAMALAEFVQERIGFNRKS